LDEVISGWIKWHKGTDGQEAGHKEFTHNDGSSLLKTGASAASSHFLHTDAQTVVAAAEAADVAIRNHVAADGLSQHDINNVLGDGKVTFTWSIGVTPWAKDWPLA